MSKGAQPTRSPATCTPSNKYSIVYSIECSLGYWVGDPIPLGSPASRRSSAPNALAKRTEFKELRCPSVWKESPAQRVPRLGRNQMEYRDADDHARPLQTRHHKRPLGRIICYDESNYSKRIMEYPGQ